MGMGPAVHTAVHYTVGNKWFGVISGIVQDANFEESETSLVLYWFALIFHQFS